LVFWLHTIGNLLSFRPHLHVMATDGAFTPDGLFHPLPTMSLARREDLFVSKMLMRMGLPRKVGVGVVAALEELGSR
jgi:hypothetical protein